MEVLKPRKTGKSSNMITPTKLKNSSKTNAAYDNNSRKLQTLVKRKMSNKIKRMDKRLKSLISTKKKLERKKTKISKMSNLKANLSDLNVSQDISPVPKYSEIDFRGNPYSPKQISLINASSTINLVKKEESFKSRSLVCKRNVYDSMEEDEELDESKGEREIVVWALYCLRLAADLAVFLSLVVGYFITRKREEEILWLSVSAVTIDLSIGVNIFFLNYFHFKESSNLEISMVKYSLTWLIVDLTSCFPVSASILVQNVGLAQVNLLFLISRVALLKKPESLFCKWVVTPSNLETNRLIKTLIVFLAIIFYFAICFRFIAERQFSLVDCFYFVVATSISVGYGDITPESSKERLFVMVVQLVGLIFYTLFISMVSGYISAMTPIKIKTKEQKEILFNIYCEHDIPLSLYQRIKEHIDDKRDNSSASMVDFIRSLPINMSRDMLNKTFRATLEKIPAFAKMSSQFTAKMLGYLNYVHYEKDETIVQTGQLCEEVLIVTKGRLKFFSGFHGAPFALARMGSGQTFGESQCFLREQAICCLVSVSAIYKGFIIKSKDFDVLAEDYAHEIGILVDESLTKHECLKLKLGLLKHCENFDMKEEEVIELIAKINRFISEIEGTPENIRKAVTNYTKKHVNHLVNNCCLRRIERVKRRRLKDNVNEATRRSPNKRSSDLTKQKVKEKLVQISTNMNSPPIKESLNFLKAQPSKIFISENKGRQGFCLSPKKTNPHQSDCNNYISSLNPIICSKINRKKETVSAADKNSNLIFLSTKITNSVKKGNREANQSIQELKSFAFSGEEKKESKDLIVRLNRKKGFQTVLVDGLLVEVKISTNVIEEEMTSERENLRFFEEMTRKLETIDQLIRKTAILD